MYVIVILRMNWEKESKKVDKALWYHLHVYIAQVSYWWCSQIGSMPMQLSDLDKNKIL